MANQDEEDTSTYTVRVEKAVYDKDGELDWIQTTNEYEFDTYEEALEEYNAYIIEPIGEMLYLDQYDEDGDQENIESRGKYKHEEEEEKKCEICSVLSASCDCDKCGIHGCYDCVVGATSNDEDINLCDKCYEWNTEEEEREERELEEYCEWLRLKDIDCGDDETLKEFKAFKAAKAQKEYEEQMKE
jgi:hypothetical protein